jgi:hypothetical protein
MADSFRDRWRKRIAHLTVRRRLAATTQSVIE